MNSKEAIELPSAIISLANEGYIRIDPRDNEMIDLEEAVRQGYAIIKLCDGKKRPFLIDTRNSFTQYTPEARDYMTSFKELTKYRAAEAYLTNSLPTIRKESAGEDCPRKMFLHENEAVDWLLGHVSMA